MRRLLLAVLALLTTVTLVACGSSGRTSSALPASSPAGASTTATGPAAGGTTVAPSPSVTAPKGMKTTTVAQLPKEAQATLRLVDQGGPFPYRQDGVVFQNREGRLPKRPDGYYHEYTVETPGSPDRGARRLIAGGAGEVYYTADHYGSFVFVVDA